MSRVNEVEVIRVPEPVLLRGVVDEKVDILGDFKRLNRRQVGSCDLGFWEVGCYGREAATM